MVKNADIEINDQVVISEETISMVSSELAWQYHIVPISYSEGSLRIFYTVLNEPQKSSIRFQIDKQISFEQKDELTVKSLLSKYYRNTRGDVREIELNSISGEAFLETLIVEAKNLESSDIHVEVFEDEGRVRIRVDGHLLERYKIQKSQYPALINRIKIKAGLDIAEKRLPQDGRIQFRDLAQELDIRVSVVPTLHGEKAVLRLLSNDATNISIDAVGLEGAVKELYLKGIKKPNGIVLISGPTGSGKTTTLYATLKELNQMDRNILTVEDPIEYTLEGVNQVQLRENIGLTFSAALRTFLRQDPDIIMLGEIRDAETAEMAMRAALTGHLVFSTIHTNSALGILARLLDMGIPPFLLANTLNTVVAQRLVRKLCPHCKIEMTSEEVEGLIGRNKFEAQHAAVGCEECHFTGYKGRLALFEVIEVDHELGQLIKTNELDEYSYLKSNEVRTLKKNALELFKAGLTSFDEISPYI